MTLLWRLVTLVGLSWLLIIEAKPHDSNTFTIITTPDMIQSHGYPVETHHVTTADGYILEMHRIPHGRDGSSSGKRPPVFLMHGLTAASNSYIAIGPEYSIGYNLADAGFDVWMGNARGSRDSRRHEFWNPDDEEDKFKFWDFTWEQIGIYDITAMTDYARHISGYEKIHYIGHSQGTTVFFVLNAMRPEYNKNFASAHLLAPVCYMEHFPNTALSAAALFTNTIWNTAWNIGFLEVGQNLINGNSEIFPETDFWTALLKEIRNVKKSEVSPLDDSVINFFGGAALKQIAHYGQNVQSKNFQRWDYGLLQNREVYGTLRPPLYDISKITVDTYLHYTVADTLAGVDDVLEMERVLPNAVSRKVANEEFDHGGFAFDTDVKELVTDYIIEKLKAAENM